ncbi:hypothetical protein [Mangrovicoccus ximenensis]|uniref:hypothetical protein n=1 Tax=Mangrovicoccus ximenensis TaxID=1911570 RepID=UPI000D384E17|nr:hypothetical protein [Mangrovicoccus ximenensis]
MERDRFSLMAEPHHPPRLPSLSRQELPIEAPLVRARWAAGKIARPFRDIRQDVLRCKRSPRTLCHALELLARSFRTLGDLNAQFGA